MEVRRAVLLSVFLSNLPTFELSVSLNSAWTPPVTTPLAHFGILKFQDCRISVPTSRLTLYLNTCKTTETIRILILLSWGWLPANEFFQCWWMEDPKDAVCIMLTRLQHSDRWLVIFFSSWILVPALIRARTMHVLTVPLMWPFVCWMPVP